MKKLLPPIGVLLLLFLLSALNSSAIARMTQQWQDQILSAESSAIQGRWDDAAAILETSCRDWEHAQLYLHIVLERSALDDAQAMYCRAMAFALAEDPAEFRAETADLRAHLTLLAETEAFSLKNIL